MGWLGCVTGQGVCGVSGVTGQGVGVTGQGVCGVGWHCRSRSR